MTSRYTTSDYLGAAGELLRLLVRHKGNLAKVNTALDAERELARRQARYGTSAVTWIDQDGKAWCQLPGEPPERLLTHSEIADQEDPQ